MIRKVVVGVLLVTAIADPLTGSAANVLHLRQVPIMDPSGFEQPKIAATMLVPANWRFQGGFRWAYSSCLTDLVSGRALAVSPDDSAGFEMFPLLSFAWADNPGAREIMGKSAEIMTNCRIAPPLNARGVVLEYIIPQFRAGAALVTADPAPEAARGLFDKSMALSGPMIQMQGGQLQTDAVRARIAYPYKGQDVEEWITASISQYALMSPMGVQYGYTTDGLFGFRAPRSQLSGYEALFATMLGSYRPNPQWMNAVITVWSNIQSGWSRTSGQMARIWAEAGAQIDQTIMSAWQYRRDTVDRVSLAYSQAMRGVDAYLDPFTRQPTELPTGYRGGAWAGSRGQYLLTDDPSFDSQRVDAGRHVAAHEAYAIDIHAVIPAVQGRRGSTVILPRCFPNVPPLNSRFNRGWLSLSFLLIPTGNPQI
jgi:hypothetical protein